MSNDTEQFAWQVPNIRRGDVIDLRFLILEFAGVDTGYSLIHKLLASKTYDAFCWFYELIASHRQIIILEHAIAKVINTAIVGGRRAGPAVYWIAMMPQLSVQRLERLATWEMRESVGSPFSYRFFTRESSRTFACFLCCAIVKRAGPVGRGREMVRFVARAEKHMIPCAVRVGMLGAVEEMMCRDSYFMYGCVANASVPIALDCGLNRVVVGRQVSIQTRGYLPHVVAEVSAWLPEYGGDTLESVEGSFMCGYIGALRLLMKLKGCRDVLADRVTHALLYGERVGVSRVGEVSARKVSRAEVRVRVAELGEVSKAEVREGADWPACWAMCGGADWQEEDNRGEWKLVACTQMHVTDRYFTWEPKANGWRVVR